MQKVLESADKIPLSYTLASSFRASASPQEQRQKLGESIFQDICRTSTPDVASIITGRLLELDTADLMHMVRERESLTAKVGEFETNFEMCCWTRRCLGHVYVAIRLCSITKYTI